MRIIFAGSAPLGCPTLDALMAMPGHEVVAVMTQPDRPSGRKLKPTPCAVRAHMAETDVPVLTPQNVNAPDSLAAVRRLQPDLLFVVAYGQFLRRELLDMPTHGCVNLHTSLLPAYRGAGPIQWAIANGETETGVTVMYMNAKMDAGDIISQVTVPIGEAVTAGELHDLLSLASVAPVRDAIIAIADGTVQRRPQDERLVTFAPKLSRQDGRLDWTRSARELYNRIRGFNPWPNCHCACPADRGAEAIPLKILRSRVETGRGQPGIILELGAAGPLVATGDDALRLVEVQPAGKRRMSGADFMHGHRLCLGQQMG